MSIAAGVGSSVVERDGERKSISTEQTFGELAHPTELLKKCQELCQILAKDLKEEKLMGKSVTLKIKTVSFEVKTRANTLNHYSNDERNIFIAAKQLLEMEIQMQQPGCLRLRLMGVRMSKLIPQTECSASVASYFLKDDINNPAWKEPVVSCMPTEEDKNPGRSFNNEKKDVTTSDPSLSKPQSPILITGSCLLENQSGNDDDSDNEDYSIFQECLENIRESKDLNVTTFSTSTKMLKKNKLQSDKKSSKKNKQETIVNFLYNRDDHQLVEGNEESFSHGQCAVKKRFHTNSTVTREDNENENNTFLNPIPCAETSSCYQGTSDRAISSDIQEASTITAGSHRHKLSLPLKQTEKFTGVGLDMLAGTSHSTGMILCPVCGQQKYQWPLDQLNTHIDLCLSRSTVKDILSDQQCQNLHSTVSKKRTRSSEVTNQNFDKRSKAQHTLLSFFKQ